MDYTYKSFYNTESNSFIELEHYKDLILIIRMQSDDGTYSKIKLDAEAMDEFVEYIKENF